MEVLEMADKALKRFDLGRLIVDLEDIYTDGECEKRGLFCLPMERLEKRFVEEKDEKTGREKEITRPHH